MLTKKEREERTKFYEDRGRNALKKKFDARKHIITDYKFDEDKYGRTDVYFTSAGTECVGEIKYRIDYLSTDPIIQREGIILEQKKLNSLLADGRHPFYVMLFPDGVGYIYDLERTDLGKKEYRWCPQTSVYGERNDVYKELYYIKLSDKNKFTF